MAVKVTFTEWPAARVTWMVRLGGVAVTCRRADVCGGDCGAGLSVATRVRFEATVSVRTAVPAPEPVFFTVIV